MAKTTKSQTFIFISHLPLLILIFLVPNLNLSTAQMSPYVYPTHTNTTTNHPLDFSSLELDAGTSEFSTWESASTHRILAGGTTNHLGAYNGLNPPAACNARRYANCISDPSTGVKRRTCDGYDRCPKGVAPKP